MMLQMKITQTEHNSNRPHIPDHPNRILIIGSSGSGKTNALLNQIQQKYDDDYNIFDKICLYVQGTLMQIWKSHCVFVFI